MNVILKRIICMTAGSIGILAALYTGLSVYYIDSFSYGTWINGIYCTGKDVPEINEALLTANAGNALTLLLPDGTRQRISPVDFGISEDFTKPLLQIRQEQNPWGWYQNLYTGSGRLKIEPARTLDEKKFDEAFETLSFVKDRKPDTAYRVWIEKTDQGYKLVNERERVPDYEACREAVRQAVLAGNADCDLTGDTCFMSLPLTGEMKKTQLLWKKVAAFQDCGIVYRFGEELEPVDGSVVSRWLIPEGNGFAEDATGTLLFDREKLEAYVDGLAEKYDTAGKKRLFCTTRGDKVSILEGTYGNRMDRKAEKQYLYQAFTEKRREIHEPAYLQKAVKQGSDDIGGTYIEVDMGNQHLYYYKDGSLLVDAPVVTGDRKRHRSTPEMVCFVYNKQKNRTLRGPGYAARVRYWMPVKGGIGIHDAGWRKEFGGDIYQTNGSHGCINVPPEAMQQIYEETKIGTPVVLFY